MVIKLIKSSFYNEQEEKEKLCEFIKGSSQFSFWKYCKLFEKKYSERQWRKYCVFFNSWSSANLALLQSLLNIWTIRKWDNVAFSSLTRATNVMPIIELWLNPIPVDVELSTLNISLKTFKETTANNDIKVLFITNLLWFCDNIDEIKKYCNENDILLLEDNCESMWTVYKWKKLWNYSFASTFSTYVWHHMSTIEWWMVCTDNKELYVMLHMVRAHWWDRNLDSELQSEVREKYELNPFYAKYTFYTLWYNLRPNDISWFIGSQQIKYLDEIVNKRQNNFRKFAKTLNSNDEFYQLKFDHIDIVSDFSVPVVCKSKEIFERYLKKFSDAWVEVRPIVWWDLTQSIFWRNLYWESNKETNAKYIHNNWFYFWNSPEYTAEEIELLCSLLKK